MALLAIKFQEDILISFYSSVVPLLGPLSFKLLLEELKETDFHSWLINHFIKKGETKKNPFSYSGTPNSMPRSEEKSEQEHWEHLKLQL